MMFKVGDRVKHKSGGPLMVVYAEGQKHPQTGEFWWYACEWFDTENRLQREDFSVLVLLPVSGEPK